MREEEIKKIDNIAYMHLIYCMAQFDNMAVKMAAIREYNALRGRSALEGESLIGRTFIRRVDNEGNETYQLVSEIRGTK